MSAQGQSVNYKTYLLLIEKRKVLFIISSLAIMTGFVIASYVMPKTYEANSTVFIEKNIIGELVKGIAANPSMDDRIKVLTYAMNSRSLIKKVVNDLDINVNKSNDAEMENVVNNLISNMKVSVKDQNLFTVSFKSRNPKLARDYVNTLVNKYIEENTSTKREESYGANRFLSEQINAFKAKMEKSEAEINKFKSTKGSSLVTDEARIYTEIKDEQSKLDEQYIRQTELESKRKLMKSANPLHDRLAAFQKQLNELRSQYTDNYPEIVRVKSEIDSLQEQLKGSGNSHDPTSANTVELTKIEVELKAVKDNQRRLQAAIDTKKRALASIPAARSMLDDLERDRNANKNIYETLISRHGQSEVSKEMEVQDKSTSFRIVDPALLPTTPISPDRKKIMLMGIIAGIAGAFGLLVFIEQFDSSIKSVDMLKVFGKPILAIIPTISNPAEIEATKRKEKRLYAISGIYFALLLMVILSELLGHPLDDLINRLI